MLSNRSQVRAEQDTFKQQIAQQQTRPYPSVSSIPHTILTTAAAPTIDDQQLKAAREPRNKNRPRIIGTVIVGVIALALYFLWKPSTPAPQTITTSQNAQPTIATPFTPDATNTTSDDANTIQVYIIGAVQHPGVYTLASNARVYQLLQAAGGAVSSANLSAINMAARLSDGQEIYLPHVGETPIPAPGGTASTGDQTALVNINTASTDQLRQSLHLSSKSAQDIVAYRLQHGAFSSVDALAQVLSKTVFDKIKNEVTV